MAGSFLAYTAAGILGLGLFGWRFEKERTTFGSARWLKPWDAMRAGLFKDRGILVGDWTGLLPVYYQDTHAITFGESGSGKGTCTILPNLLRTRFAFINDPGGENAAVAIKAWRDAGFEVSVINPFGMHGEEPWVLPMHGFNPLDILDPASRTFAASAKLIAEQLITRGGNEGGSSKFFKDAAESFLQAALMFMTRHYAKEDRHLGALFDLAYADKGTWDDLLEKMQDTADGKDLVSKIANAMDRREEQASAEFSAIMSTLQQDLTWLGDPIVQENLKRSDIDFAALKGTTRDGKKLKGAIIAVVLPLEFNESHAAIPRLALGCAIQEMQRTPLAREKVLFLIDEAAALGKVSRFPNWLATLRKYRVVLWPIFQNLGQVEALYDRGWQTFLANCGLRQFIGVGDLQTAEHVTKLLGQLTVKTQSLNHEGKLSESEARRSLMDIDEILYAASKEQLVFMGKNRPAVLKKTPYWERPELRGTFHRNPYQTRKSPFVFGRGAKELKGSLYYALVFLLTPHPVATTAYLSAIAAAIAQYAGYL
ncbi:type IV secretory system conjugative DNA transfer family protein [Sedimentitalea sp. JM2-8]|uniref:Type IV secretory system conjugative DNA transfer family protein n=1 Tax=Sedimentitalea xiamensis TaxID=3050037 RepID=A0ABT7FKD7_9RHOB|nr:type IV secretory system conjugative DNA transfer family protein [Sedimentitalea xiamensis]MDK3075480.1 type IV secretory system conjugative DNA transfer family protein [Sedimentitalea xiamensis]